MRKYTDFVKVENDSILVDCDDDPKLVIALVREDEEGRVCKVNETSYEDYPEFTKAIANQLTVMKTTKKKMTKCHIEFGSLKIFNFICLKPIAFYKLVIIGAKGNWSDLKELYDRSLD